MDWWMNTNGSYKELHVQLSIKPSAEAKHSAILPSKTINLKYMNGLCLQCGQKDKCRCYKMRDIS